MRGKQSRLRVLIYALGALPVVWIALLLAPSLSEGLPGLLRNLGSVFDHPFAIQWGENSLKTVLALLCVYGLCLVVYLSSDRNYRRREEYGSAKWGSPEKLLRKYAEREYERNKILTQNVRIGLNTRIHLRNLNVVVCGGSGSRKSRGIVMPNLLNANTSFVVLDPKGELLRYTGHLLEERGYKIKVFDLIHMERSHCYNPFAYVRDDIQIQRLCTTVFKSTTPKGSQTQDPFWDGSAEMLLKALVFYLHYEAPPDEQNFAMVIDMIRAGDVKEDNPNYMSPLDTLFTRLKYRNPEHPAVKFYDEYKSGAGKTLKSIQITLLSHLEKFTLDSVSAITQCDEMELSRVGEEKTAIFAIIPDNDTSFNFLVSVLYTQLFQELEESADYKHKGKLPIHVHFLMDEFANVNASF